MTNLKENATVVDALGSCLRNGNHALGTAPQLLKRVLRDEMWRDFITQRGDRVHHDRFADFVTAPPLKGIGAKVDLIRRIVEPDPEALDLLDRALQNVPYIHASPGPDVDNINVRPTGTSKEYALRRLRKDAPELHAKVLSGEITPHAAMVQAGFRPPTFTIRADKPDSVVATLRRQLAPDMLAEVVRLLGA